MSKLLSRRIPVAVLIGLIIVLGVFITAQAASVNSGSVSGRADVTAGDPYYASQQRGVSQNLSPLSTDFHKGGGGCNHEVGIDPNDY
jgi:hypothetical protein